ncbi:conserved protein, unknown function [Hepatocystis sp. ex Piliocolobus tephrosceles]|nr:conserved protein, unknown function [Hepatocystis sp. ex Piliocolobus tephrosceles]
MEDFLIKLKKISEQYNNLLLQKKIIDKRIANIGENIIKYEETKCKSLKEMELKKNQLLKNKNKHLIKCQKMEELNHKLNEILIRKQSIDDEEEKQIIRKQIDTVNNTYMLLKNVQNLNDAIIKDNNNYYKTIIKKIHNNSFSDKKTLNILNSFINKSRANLQEKGNENENNKCILNLKTIQSTNINAKLILLLSTDFTTLTLEKQQFLFVLLMNALQKLIQPGQKISNEYQSKSNEVIYNYLYNSYISTH